MIILLTSLLCVAFRVEKVQANGTIYIRADGSIDPPTANISTADNVTYTFLDNNYDSIVVERDNIVIDGASYTLQGAGSGNGIVLSGRSNVTLRDIEIKAFGCGVGLNFSSSNVVSGNNISNNEFSIGFSFSSGNTISENNITNNGAGVWLINSSSNTISENNITNNGAGVWLDSFSNYNTVSGNSFIDDGLYVRDSFGNVVIDNLVNGKPLVYLEDVSDLVVEEAGQVILVNCNRIRVENLTLSNAVVGVQLCHTNNTTITGNKITNNGFGVFLTNSSINTVSGNNITANAAAGVWLISSSNNNSISGNIISANSHDGIWVSSSASNTVSGNNISDNLSGVLLTYSAYNTVSGNKITNNWRGVYLDESLDNIIYHNNFVDNTQQTYIMVGSTNVWDNGCEGNFWSNYAGSDSDGDGIGDTPYMLDGSNQDQYPLMNPYWTPGDIDHDLDVDIYDIVKAAGIYGSTLLDPEWNPHCDIAEPYGIIDIFDIVMIAMSYGEEY